MSGLVLEQAVKSQRKGRVSLLGPTGAGKTWTALEFAKAFGPKVIVIDTENGSASLYADKFSFKRINLPSFSAKMYREAIALAERDSPDVIIIDSLSHAWAGKDGTLEFVDKEARRSGSDNTFAAWRKASPEHNALVDAIIRCSTHVIVTMRVKMKYAMVKNANGKMEPKRIALQPVQREGIEFEFDLICDMDQAHTLKVSKTRCSLLDGFETEKPTREVAQTFKTWLDDGAPAPADEPTRPLPPPVSTTPASKPNGNGATPPPPTTREDGTPYLPADDDNALVVVAERLETLNHPKAIDSWLKKHFKADVEPRGEVFVANVKDLVGKRRAELAEALAPKDDAPPPEEP